MKLFVKKVKEESVVTYSTETCQHCCHIDRGKHEQPRSVWSGRVSNQEPCSHRHSTLVHPRPVQHKYNTPPRGSTVDLTGHQQSPPPRGVPVVRIPNLTSVSSVARSPSVQSSAGHLQAAVGSRGSCPPPPHPPLTPPSPSPPPHR